MEYLHILLLMVTLYLMKKLWDNMIRESELIDAMPRLPQSMVGAEVINIF